MQRLIRPLRAVVREVTNGDADPVFFAILAVSFVLCSYHLSWGLPNDNYSWANDAIGPLSILAVAKRSLGQFNSGWFWYKYPFGYPLLMLVVYAPYLGWLLATGQWSNPSMTYPYGFSDPETAMYRLAMLGRWVSVVSVVGMVALTYGIGHRLLGRAPARLAAWFVATSYTMIFHAHSTNQDAVYGFWLILSWWAALVCSEGLHRLWPFVLLGFSASMSMATKEQGFSLLLTLPPLIALSLYRLLPPTVPAAQRIWQSLWNRGTRAALLTSVVTALIGFNAILNPQGIANRLSDLSGHPVPGLSSRLTPLKFALFKGWAKEWWYLNQIIDGSLASFGTTITVLYALGMVYLVWKQRRVALFLWVPTLAYAYVSLRIHNLLNLRYLLPIFPSLTLSAALLCTLAIERFRKPAVVLVSVLCLVSLARGIEMDVVLRNDSRYDAEAWMAEHMPRGSTVEFYQKRVYVPRFPGLSATLIPIEERTLEGIAARRPQYLVLSDASRRSITHIWNPDWTKGGLLLERPWAREFLQALDAGKLPYRQVASFSQTPKLLRMRVISLCPTIRIYQRTDDGAAEPEREAPVG